MALSDCSSRYHTVSSFVQSTYRGLNKDGREHHELSAKNTHGCWQQDTCRVVSMLQGGPKEFSPLMCWDCVAYRRFARSTAQSGSEVQASLGFRQCHGAPVACRLEGLLSPYVDWDEDRTLRCGRTKLDRMEPAGAVGDAQERVYITELVFTSFSFPLPRQGFTSGSVDGVVSRMAEPQKPQPGSCLLGRRTHFPQLGFQSSLLGIRALSRSSRTGFCGTR